MCLILIAHDAHKEYSFIAAANRDEFYKRPTRKAQLWDEHPHLLAGKDLEAGGTWLGVDLQHRFSALTNYRDPSKIKQVTSSRGTLVLNYLRDTETSATDYLEKVSQTKHLYNGFNLLLRENKDLYYIGSETPEPTLLSPGIYGLSNALLDTPWPKLTKAKQDFKKAISKKKPDFEEIFSLLNNDVLAADADLPATGVPYEWEKAISSIFIKAKGYGTRCSTIVAEKKTGELKFIERRYKEGSNEILEESHYFL